MVGFHALNYAGIGKQWAKLAKFRRTHGIGVHAELRL